MGLLGLDHVIIRVSDASDALRYYRDVLGLAEIAEEDGVQYLGCGGDEYADVGLVNGGQGIVSFAMAVHDTSSLDEVRSQLDSRGIAHGPLEQIAPGITDGLSLRLPSDHLMQVVVRRDKPPYVHDATWLPEGVDAPFDIDHVTLHANDVKGAADFLVENLGFRVTDVFEVEGRWAFAFCRVGDWHHDVAIAGTETDTRLHHFAFLTKGIADQERFADRVTRMGHKSEYGIGRHGPGSNLFLYMRDPTGNRVELTSEMARVTDPDEPPRIWRGDFLEILNVWMPLPPPDSFMEGT
jgi:catechol 2,3-dioxygenase